METPHSDYPEIGVVVLGGGEATRLPEKLALPVGELPMIVRVVRNFSPEREIVVAAKAGFPREIDALLTVPLAIDRWSRRGPLGGLMTTLACMRARFVFAVAADAPLVDERFLVALAAERQSGDEAVVPAHGAGLRRLEPLAALYDRLAFLREGMPVLRSGDGALRAALARLHTRLVPFGDVAPFANVNTPADYAALRERSERKGGFP